MKLPVKALSAAILLFVLFVPSFAGEKDIVINADSVSYRKEEGFVEATGSVEATYKNINIKASHLVYYTGERKILAEGNCTLSKDNFRLTGDKLLYFLRTESGTAENIVIFAGSAWIKGASVAISPEQIFISEASFSSCDLQVPHYKISSNNMVYYPGSGWITEYLGLFWIRNIPVFPVPTYVYDTRQDGFYRRGSPAPLPEFGTDQYDGTYLKEKIVWRISSYSYGMAKIEWASKKGIGLGFEGNYVANDANEGTVRLETLGSDGFSGGVAHTYYFGEDVPRERLRQLLYEVLQVPPRKKYDLTTEISYRELNNYERVTLLPQVTLRYIDVPFKFINFNPKVELSAANISEESSGISLIKTNLKSSFDYLHPLSGDSDLRAGLDFSYTNYGSLQNWTSFLGRVDVRKAVYDKVNLTAGYSHYFMNDGSSPFNYENYRYFPFDDIRFGASCKIGYSSLGVLFSYNTPLLTARDIDYNATIGMHCFDISLTWRAMRGEALLGILLVSR